MASSRRRRAAQSQEWGVAGMRGCREPRIDAPITLAEAGIVVTHAGGGSCKQCEQCNTERDQADPRPQPSGQDDSSTGRHSHHGLVRLAWSTLTVDCSKEGSSVLHANCDLHRGDGDDCAPCDQGCRPAACTGSLWQWLLLPCGECMPSGWTVRTSGGCAAVRQCADS